MVDHGVDSFATQLCWNPIARPDLIKAARDARIFCESDTHLLIKKSENILQRLSADGLRSYIFSTFQESGDCITIASHSISDVSIGEEDDTSHTLTFPEANPILSVTFRNNEQKEAILASNKDNLQTPSNETMLSIDECDALIANSYSIDTFIGTKKLSNRLENSKQYLHSTTTTVLQLQLDRANFELWEMLNRLGQDVLHQIQAKLKISTETIG